MAHRPVEPAGRPHGEVVISPRVIDQASFDGLAESLRSSLAAAAEARDGLEADCAHAADATSQLQDRLRVGARMLKALQLQIERAEEVLGELDGRAREMEDRADALARLVESAEVNIAVLSFATARRATERRSDEATKGRIGSR